MIQIQTGVDNIEQKDFDEIRRLMLAKTGITLNDKKRQLVISRLTKRLAVLELSNYSQYVQYLNSDRTGAELQELINCLTTNKTDFFREEHHFDFLRDHVIAQNRLKGRNRLRIWSSACSSGEEPYTIAITILEAIGKAYWDITLDASDISSHVLKLAAQGNYDMERVAEIPLAIKQKYFLRGTGNLDGLCRIRDNVRKMVRFRMHNLMESRRDSSTKYDVIFCRNALIYFNDENQRRIVGNLLKCLAPEGYLILGHSENMHWLPTLLKPIGNTIHQLV